MELISCNICGATRRPEEEVCPNVVNHPATPEGTTGPEPVEELSENSGATESIELEPVEETADDAPKGKKAKK